MGLLFSGVLPRSGPVTPCNGSALHPGYPLVSLKEARQAHDEARRQLLQGIKLLHDRLLVLVQRLLRHRHDAGVDHLSTPRDVAVAVELPAHGLEDALSRTGLDQPLLERPDRRAVGSLRTLPQPHEALKAQPVQQLKLHLLVALTLHNAWALRVTDDFAKIAIISLADAALPEGACRRPLSPRTDGEVRMITIKTIVFNATIAISLVVIIGFNTRSDAQFFKWRDQNGAIHYTDTPPPNSSYKSKEMHNAPQTNPADQIDAEKRLAEDKASIAALQQKMRNLKRQEEAQSSPTNQLEISLTNTCMQEINTLEHGNFSGFPDISFCRHTSAAAALDKLCAEKINNGSWKMPPPFCLPH